MRVLGRGCREEGRSSGPERNAKWNGVSLLFLVRFRSTALFFELTCNSMCASVFDFVGALSSAHFRVHAKSHDHVQVAALMQLSSA